MWPEEIFSSVWFSKVESTSFDVITLGIKRWSFWFFFSFAQLGHGRMEWISQCERNSRIEKWKMSVVDLGVGSESMTLVEIWIWFRYCLGGASTAWIIVQSLNLPLIYHFYSSIPLTVFDAILVTWFNLYSKLVYSLNSLTCIIPFVYVKNWYQGSR